MSATQSNVHVLIPKQLRLDWVDLMALDPDLSDLAFRVGCIIGKHFNAMTGFTFVGLPGLAKLVRCSRRAAWGAVRELEERGFLLVKHARGRGHANEYRLAIGKALATASMAAEKLAQRCTFYETQKVQNRVIKGAAGCTPTLTSPSGRNTAADFRELGKAGERLRDRVGPEVFAAWFTNVTAEVADDGKSVTLTAPSAFTADLIRERYLDAAVDSWRMPVTIGWRRSAAPPPAADGSVVTDERAARKRGVVAEAHEADADATIGELMAERARQAGSVA